MMSILMRADSDLSVSRTSQVLTSKMVRESFHREPETVLFEIKSNFALHQYDGESGPERVSESLSKILMPDR